MNQRPSIDELVRTAARELEEEMLPPSEEGKAAPSGFDVLTGRRRAKPPRHEGNSFYRRLVEGFGDLYEQAAVQRKPDVTRKLVYIVRNLGGQFLRYDCDSKLYYEVGDKVAIEKTSQCLRSFTFNRRSRKAPAEPRKNNDSDSYYDDEGPPCHPKDDSDMPARSDHRPALRPTAASPIQSERNATFKLTADQRRQKHGPANVLKDVENSSVKESSEGSVSDMQAATTTEKRTQNTPLSRRAKKLKRSRQTSTENSDLTACDLSYSSDTNAKKANTAARISTIKADTDTGAKKTTRIHNTSNKRSIGVRVEVNTSENYPADEQDCRTPCKTTSPSCSIAGPANSAIRGYQCTTDMYARSTHGQAITMAQPLSTPLQRIEVGMSPVKSTATPTHAMPAPQLRRYYYAAGLVPPTAALPGHPAPEPFSSHGLPYAMHPEHFLRQGLPAALRSDMQMQYLPQSVMDPSAIGRYGLCHDLITDASLFDGQMYRAIPARSSAPIQLPGSNQLSFLRAGRLYPQAEFTDRVFSQSVANASANTSVAGPSNLTTKPKCRASPPADSSEQRR